MGESYQNLVAWQKAMDLVVAVYALTECFPRSEQYGLTAQLQRAAVSVPSNIAEGQARHSQPEFYRFLSHARGSLAEAETQIHIALRLRYVTRPAAQAVLDQAAELGRVLNGLLAAIGGRVAAARAATEN